MDHKSFRSLLNEATSVLSNKNSTNNSEYCSLQEAVESNIITEEEAYAIDKVLFEERVLTPNLIKLVEDIENYYGVELTEEQLDEMIRGLAALTGAAVGGIGGMLGKAKDAIRRTTSDVVGGAVGGVKKAAGAVTGAVKGAAGAASRAISDKVSPVAKRVMDIYAAGERAGGVASQRSGEAIQAAGTAREKLGKALGDVGRSTRAAYKAGRYNRPKR